MAVRFDPDYDAQARVRSIANSTAARQRLYPEHLPKVLRLREQGVPWAKIGKRFGLCGGAVREFVKRCKASA